MSALYWFALVVGAGLLLLSLAGDLFGEADADLGGDADLDADHAHADGMKILSMRNATYFLFGFGGAGVLLSLLQGGAAPLVTALVATLVGLVSGGISAAAFGYLGRTGSGEMRGDATWAGCTGVVLLPLAHGGTGKITVARAGREHTLLARPFDAAAGEPESWRSVVVIEVRDGVAYVEPFDTALGDPDRPRITGHNTEQ